MNKQNFSYACLIMFMAYNEALLNIPKVCILVLLILAKYQNSPYNIILLFWLFGFWDKKP